MISGISGNEFSNDWINQVFSQVDSDANGQIDQSEFQEAFSKILTEKMSGKNRPPAAIDEDKLFAKIDQDSDGSISKEEFSSFIETQKKMPPPPMPYGFNLLDLLMSANAGDLFSEMDTDGDGTISQKEFVQYLEQQKGILGANQPPFSAGINPEAITDS